jgi:Uridine kinase
MNDRADANQFNLDLLEEDIEQLLERGLDFILLDYSFGYRHDKIAKYIDLSIFIDTPLDIALARRLLRDYKGVSGNTVFEDI